MKWISVCAIGILVILIGLFIHLSQVQELEKTRQRNLKMAAFFKAEELVEDRIDPELTYRFGMYHEDAVLINSLYQITSSFFTQSVQGLLVEVGFRVFLEFDEESMKWELIQMVFFEPD